MAKCLILITNQSNLILPIVALKEASNMCFKAEEIVPVNMAHQKKYRYLFTEATSAKLGGEGGRNLKR